MTDLISKLQSTGEGSRLTRRARAFVEVNQVWRVLSGQWLDQNRRPVTGPPESWVKLRYRFTSGQQITLDRSDLESLDRAGIKPIWYGVRALQAAEQGDG